MSSKRGQQVIINFSTLGGGDGRHVDLCGECKYTIKIQRHNHAPQISWLTGDQITQQYGTQDVKITIQGIKRCHRHAARGNNAKPQPAFLNAALRSGIEINPGVDDYRDNILKTRHPNVRL